MSSNPHTPDPARDCPPCPACDMPMGTPIKSAGIERWDGPEDATLFCPMCGTGWVGIPEHVAQAEKSWAAYEAAFCIYCGASGPPVDRKDPSLGTWTKALVIGGGEPPKDEPPKGDGTR